MFPPFSGKMPWTISCELSEPALTSCWTLSSEIINAFILYSHGILGLLCDRAIEFSTKLVLVASELFLVLLSRLPLSSEITYGSAF